VILLLLEVKDLTKQFGGLHAVDGLSVAVEKGEIVGLIGPNGAGKTTIFNILTGVYPPTGGEVKFNGEIVSGLKPWNVCKKGIARTFQLVKAFPNITVLENAMIGALVRTKDVEKAREKAEEVLKFVGLYGKKDVQARALTLVERKLVEVARCLCTDPALLLLDEVIAGLNPVEVDNAVRIVRRIRDDKGITLVVVEHVMRVVMGISDRVVVINEGKKIAEGTPKEVSSDKNVIMAYLGTEALKHA
jgi:branched-chain amino acid transport system ATP-binding protein